MPYMANMIGADLSTQAHIKELLNTRQVTLSDVFTAVQGTKAMALHVPIFDEGVFQGSIAIFVPYAKLTKEYLAPIQIGENVTRLAQGESIHFNSALHHKLSNPNPEAAELLVVVYVP